MALPVDFTDAHRRHWEDAELLFNRRRLGNADQLYGFSAECGIKAVMAGLGMALGPSGRPPSKYARHVHDLWPLFGKFASRHGGGRYAKQLAAQNPFSGWSHHDRYARKGYAGRGEVSKHRAGAQQVRLMVQVADWDGTL